MRLAITILSTLLASQNPAVRTLTKPVEFPQPFISVSGLRELKDGRVLVTDLRDGTIQLLDFATGKSTPVSRKGSGPNEFGRPARLLALTPDTTAMYDPRNARFLLIGPDGKPAGTQPVEPKAIGLLGDLVGGDSHGRIYARFHAGADRRVDDTTPIIRYGVRTKVLDTLVQVRGAKEDVFTSIQAGGGFVLNMPVPFAVHDEWAPLSDGRVAVVVGRDYHVDFYDAVRSRVAGPPARYTPIPVAPKEKDSIEADRRPNPAATFTAGRMNTEPSVWYTVKPPFGENAAMAGANGDLWVAISRQFGDSIPKFDQFDAKGIRRATIALPARSRVIGFGNHSVYVIRKDADDQQFLQRFELRQ